MGKKTDCWSILKINPTDNIREIKKAYAQQLRIYNPEDDQLGFMILRESYEQALNWASVSKYDDDTMVAQLDEQLAEILQDNTDEDSFDYSDTLSIKPKEQLAELLSDNTSKEALIFEQLAELYNCFERRTSSNEWQRFFDSLNVSEFQVLQNIVVWFLNEHYVLPRYIWYYLDSEFNFSSSPLFNWAFLMDKPQHDTCAPLLTIFRDDMKALNIDLAQYAGLRADAYIAYIKDDWGPAENFARQAIMIYHKDYLTQAILAEALAFTGEKQKAVDYYKRSLSLQSDYRMHYSLARTWLELGEYKKASKEFKKLRNIFSAKDRREQKLVKEQFLKYEEMFLDDRLRVGEITKIGYSFRKNTLQQAKQISFVYRSPQNSWWMAVKGYIPIILSVSILMTVRLLLHC
ncbi:MAG: J domain-containing protein [Chloroflexi bacterium]|nr:J domain-containing protein [Chloroflexota bacterium]